MSYKIEKYEDPLKLPDEEFERHLALLPAWRRAKVLSYRHRIDRCLSLLAYVLLRCGLYRWYGIEQSEPLRFGYNKNEKPSLVDYPHIYFNISHCYEAVACVFSSHPIGVDVEGLIDYDELLLQRVANQEEQRLIVDAEDPVLAFTTLWTKKESYMKMTGIGLIDDLHHVLDEPLEIGTHFEHTYSHEKRYVLSICEMV